LTERVECMHNFGPCTSFEIGGLFLTALEHGRRVRNCAHHPNSKSEAGEPMSSQQLLVRECLQTGTLSARPETIHYSEPYTRVIVPVIKKVCAQEIDLHPPTQVLGEKVVPAAAQNP